MEIEEEISDLVANITSWLSSGPREEDIWVYAKALPEEQYPTLVYSALVTRDFFYEDMQDFWVSLQSNIPEVMDAITQVELITDLSQYAPASVYANYHNRFTTLQFNPSIYDYHTWANKKLAVWQAANAAKITPDYLGRLVFAHSILKMTDEKVAAVRACFEKIYETDRRAVEDHRELLPNEEQEQHNALVALKIFPDEYLAVILDRNNYGKKATVLSGFLTCFELLDSVGLEAARADQVVFDQVIWEQMLDFGTKQSLIYLQNNYPLPNPVADSIQAWLTTHWTLAALREGKIEGEISTYYQTLDAAGQTVFKQKLRAFLNSSPVAEQVAEPLDVRYMNARLQEVAGNTVVATELILKAVNDIPDEEHRQLAIKMFQLYFNVLNY